MPRSNKKDQQESNQAASNEADGLSEYEKVRLDNIRRNEEYLNSLGLKSIKQGLPSSAAKSKKSKNYVRPETQERRQSLRLAQIPAVKYDENILDKLEKLEDQYSDDVDGKKRKRATPSLTSSTIVRPPPSADSSRALKAQLDVLLGDDILGKKVDGYGKLAVMALANGGKAPRFNKYSGFVEWSNSVFLWVNLGDDKSEYPNQFSDGGKYITWFGGSKVHEESDIIKRLISLGKKSDTPTTPVSDSILLFARLQGESYCCLGRLSHAKYDLKSHPVSFLWSLQDFDKIKSTKDFKDLLDNSS